MVQPLYLQHCAIPMRITDWYAYSLALQYLPVLLMTHQQATVRFPPPDRLITTASALLPQVLVLA